MEDIRAIEEKTKAELDEVRLWWNFMILTCLDVAIITYTDQIYFVC